MEAGLMASASESELGFNNLVIFTKRFILVRAAVDPGNKRRDVGIRTAWGHTHIHTCFHT